MSEPACSRSTFWRRLFALAVATNVVVDAVLLTLGTDLVLGNFGAIPATPGSLAAYAVGSAVVDAWLVLCLWILAFPFLRRFGGGRIRCASLGLIIATAPTLLAAIVSYRVHSILGGMVRTRLIADSLTDLSTVSSSVAEAWILGIDEAIFVAAVGGLLCIPLLARRFEAQSGATPIGVPSLRGLVLVAVAAGGVGTAALAASRSQSDVVRLGLPRKASGQLLHAGIERLTDWDRDGWGWLSRPSDPDPFDGSIFPYAVEIPGNGIDDNGIGGDGPAVVPTAPEDRAEIAHAGTRPVPILMIFLEGFRPELVDFSLDGKPVAPFLSALARSGVSSTRAYVHTPWTLQSRDQLFRGRVDEDRRGRSLIDDLHDRGYFVAHFSGQDDSYGDSAADLGFDRADVFYDARQDLDRRTSRTTASVSLQVSWKTLLDRVEHFLANPVDGDRPLFLYVNVVDTHFPYTHSELDEIVASPELPRNDIRIDNAARIHRTYVNAAANVDRALERLVVAWRAYHADRPTALLITGDHGEAFYEQGTLGHGQTIDALESRVPLIVQGLRTRFHEPIAISEIRERLLDALADPDPTGLPELVADPNKRIFQYLGSLAEPERIALRGIAGTTVLDLHENLAWQLGPDDERLEAAPSTDEVDRLVWTWEQVQRAQRASR